MAFSELSQPVPILPASPKFHPCGRSPEVKLLFFLILSKLPPTQPPPSPQFGQLADVKKQDLKVSL